MGYSNDAPAPGGWFRQTKVRIATILVLGTAGIAGAFTLFGTFNGGQVEHVAEGAVETQTGSEIVAFAERNPFSGTAAILASYDQGIFVDENTTVAGSLDVGVAANAASSGQNIFNNALTVGAKRFLSTAATGSTIRTSGMVLVGSGKYVTATWSTTSGATTSGNDPVAIRLKWINVSDLSDTVDF